MVRKRRIDVGAVLRSWPRAELAELARETRRRGLKREVFFYPREGRRRFIPISVQPWVLSPARRRELRDLVLVIERAAAAVFRARRGEAELRRLFPFTADEEEWMARAYGARPTRPETFFSRIDLGGDAVAGVPQVLEVNLVGIGATYYCASAGRIAQELMAERLAPAFGGRLRAEEDPLELIAGRCLRHARRIGRREPTIAFVEDRRVLLGPYEFEHISRELNRRGYRTLVADPRELKVSRGEVIHRGRRVDILYRDPTLAELIDMEREEGRPLGGLRRALARNQVVSSLAGEIDHKGLLEILQAPRWRRLVPPAQRSRLARCIPWTRILRPVRTESPGGREVDLAEFARRSRQRLVIKPNRDYGGSGILLGPRSSASEWDREIERGLAEPASRVVQALVPLRREAIPVLERGRLAFRPRYLVSGVHATERGVALLARFSREPVVNITRGGGIAGVLVAPAGRSL